MKKYKIDDIWAFNANLNFNKNDGMKRGLSIKQVWSTNSSK